MSWERHSKWLLVLFAHFLKFSPMDVLTDFREKGRERKREKNIERLPVVHPLTGDRSAT